MKKVIISTLSVLLMVSCQKNELVPEYVSGECDLYASIESLDATKTVMDEDNNVLWSAGDQIVAFMGTTIGVKYQIKDSFVGSSAGGFSKVADSESGDDLVAGQEIDHNVVLYPYSASAWCMKNDSNTPTSSYKLNVVLPETQFYAENSFGIGAFPMVAVSEDNNLTFKNICGGLKLQFIGTAKIKSIKLEGLAGEKISGKSSVVACTENGVPRITMATDDESYSHVTLDCGEGVQLSETNPTTFIIAVPPMEFASGMQITVTDTDGLSRTLTNSSPNTIKRSSLLKFPVITYKQEGASPAPSEPEGDDVDINQYIVYNGTGKNNNTVISGDSSWNLEPFFYSRVSDIDEIEMKFQMGPSTASSYDSEMRWLFSSERPYTNNGARLSSEGLVLRYGNFGEDVIKNEKVITWDEMGVSMTDKIVLKISVSQQKITINGKEISVPGMETFTDIEYLFSSYYYVNDDGYAKNYVTVPVESKLYYAKIWNTEGSLLYHGYASEGEKSAGNTQPVWKSEYNGSTRLEFPNTNFQSFWVSSYTTSWLPFGGGIDEDVVNLSEGGTANSYIVSQKGTYKFSTVKGNSSESVGAVVSAEVLWETFGTNVTPNVGDLIKSVSYDNSEITFQTAETFKEGNAVIAAKDSEGTILWSWHIWLTDEPQGQEYYNNAGTMMDRNLGATSATPGDVGALGLLYQWGRKDPFLGSSSISNNVEVESTIAWPSVVSSDASTGTIEYATTNPTVFIISNNENSDWYYTGSSSTDDTRWTTSNSNKSIYDPCPVGWRVPDGGDNGVWSKALGSSSSFTDSSLYDSTSVGMNFSGKFGSDQTIWYPASGCRTRSDGGLRYVGIDGYYWSASPGNYNAYGLYFYYYGAVYPSGYGSRASGRSVRCLQE